MFLFLTIYPKMLLNNLEEATFSLNDSNKSKQNKHLVWPAKNVEIYLSSEECGCLSWYFVTPHGPGILFALNGFTSRRLTLSRFSEAAERAAKQQTQWGWNFTHCLIHGIQDTQRAVVVELLLPQALHQEAEPFPTNSL